MDQNVIAIICDCDGTLCPDTSDQLVRDLGLDADRFWKDQVASQVEEGWDHTLAYLNQFLKSTRDGPSAALTRDRMQATGSATQFYPGALEFIQNVRVRLSGNHRVPGGRHRRGVVHSQQRY